ncbi:MAG: YggS family pyridoxal phosphate-dependent enzyme [Bacteroidales bacterium]|nr:MAG: YggS family pyridoxal phosphate-dependent enzyme [Bacteroidales bacterium]
MTNDIEGNIQAVLTRIGNACRKYDRKPEDVKLLMAVKTVTPEIIKKAIATGQQLIAENKVQEVKNKYEALRETPHISHFIGHLQTNKVKDLLKCDISCIQSIDRLSLAEKIDQRLSIEGKNIDVFIQVNTSGEDSKFGVAPEEAIDLVRQVALLPTINIKGLMTIGILSEDEDRVRQCFRILKRLQKEIRSLQIPTVEMNELSMGMSGDLEIAIEEGATIVRVGSDIFGKRNYMLSAIPKN